MKKILLLAFLIVPTVMFGQSNIQVFRAGSGSSTNSAAVASQISDSLENLTLGVDITTSADSVLVVDDGKLKVISKAEFLADIYSALNQMSGLDLTAPTIDSIEIGRYNDSILVAFFHESDTHIDSIPPISAFNLTEGGTTVGLDTILFSATGDSLMVVMDSLAEYGSTYLLDYTKAYTHVQDSAGNDLANFSNMAVSNYVSEPEAPSSNMISNGTFDGMDDWYSLSGWTVNDGVATYDDISSYATIAQSAENMITPILPNTAYTLTFTLSSPSGNANLGIYDYSTVSGYSELTNYTSGNITIQFTTSSDISQGGIAFMGTTASDGTFTIDNIVLIPQ